MKSETAQTELDTQSSEELVPTVIAKGRTDAPPVGLGRGTKEEQNATEIARLSKWATGECGSPILPD